MNEAIKRDGVCDHVLVVDNAQNQLSFLLSQPLDEPLMVRLDPLFLWRIPGEGVKAVVYRLSFMYVASYQ